MSHPPTIICDIDGTLCKHRPVYDIANHPFEILPGVIEQLYKWEREGCRLILITGRAENLRKITEEQLTRAGIAFQQLIMGVGGGPRVLVNDKKADGSTTAFAINVVRDVGIGTFPFKDSYGLPI